MSKQSACKRRKPTKTDKAVYMNFGMQGKFSVDDLMVDYQTIDFNNLPEAQAEQVDPEAAALTLDLLVKYKGNVPAEEWNRAVRAREEGAMPEGSEMMTFTADEMREPELEPCLSSDSDEEVLLTATPHAPDWKRYSAEELRTFPPLTFASALRYDTETNMVIEDMLDLRKSSEQWQKYMSSQLNARYHSSIEMGSEGTVAYFYLQRHFVAMYFSSDNTFRNYFYLKTEAEK